MRLFHENALGFLNDFSRICLILGAEKLRIVVIYSSGQKFLNDYLKWHNRHNFFVSQPIDLKFWSKLYIPIVIFWQKIGKFGAFWPKL
jgi:hypothetical protein